MIDGSQQCHALAEALRKRSEGDKSADSVPTVRNAGDACTSGAESDFALIKVKKDCRKGANIY
ncbi:hypothetical protein ACM1PE_23360 [Achromobacter sp. PD1]|uniref:hypothetical protein n=1 Tax=Achromobacter sp. PD1 TaxID=3399125 RepID=UPI000A40635F